MLNQRSKESYSISNEVVDSKDINRQTNYSTIRMPNANLRLKYVNARELDNVLSCLKNYSFSQSKFYLAPYGLRVKG